MMYGHQIKKADACNNKLDDGISGLVWNGNLAKIIVVVKLFFMALVLFFPSIYYRSDLTVHPSAPLVIVGNRYPIAFCLFHA